MASKKFQIDMALNTSGVVKGATDANKAMSQLEKVFGKIGSEAGSSGRDVDQLAAKLVKASREAGKTDDEIKDALRELGYNAKDATRAVDDLGDDFNVLGRVGERSMDDIEDSMRKVQVSADDTASKITGIGDAGVKSSFQITRAMSTDIRQAGDAIGDIMEGRFAGAAHSLLGATTSLSQALPLIGIGIAGATALGLPAINALREEQEKLNASVADWAEKFIESGQRVVTQGQQVAKAQDILNNSYSELQDNARLWGVEEETALAAMSGSPAAIDAVTQALERKRVAAEADAKAAQEAAEANGSALLSLTPLEVEVNKGQEALNKLTGALEQAGDRADVFDYFLQDLVDSAGSAEVAVDELGNMLLTLPDGTEVLIDVDTGKAILDVDKFGEDVDGVIEHLNAEEITMRVATQQALEAVKSAAAIMSQTTATVQVDADTSSAEAAIENLRWRRVGITVGPAGSGWD